MATIHGAGTFAYVAVVPDDGGVFECAARPAEPLLDTEARLVGLSPSLHVSDAGLTPDANSERPLVMRSLIRLTATARRRASVAEASFHVDRALARSMRAGDVVHLVRTAEAGLGLSVLRGQTLVAAAGDLTAVPLGPAVSATVPMDLVRAAEAVFRERDPEFSLSLAMSPLEVHIEGECVMLTHGRRQLGLYELEGDHGVRTGRDVHVPAAIFRRDLCPDVAAFASALLMVQADALTTVGW